MMSGIRWFEFRVAFVVAMLMTINVVVSAEGIKDDQISGDGVTSLFVTTGSYEIKKTQKGDVISVDDFGHLLIPGKPMLPAKNFLIALPPGAMVQSVEVMGTGVKQIPGKYRIAPAPPIMPLVDPGQYPEIVEKMQQEWQKNKQAVYSTDEAYPEERGKLTGSGTLRKYSYASVSFCPFSYHPRTGRLVYYDGAEIIIHYRLPSPGGPEAQRIERLKGDILADEQASRLFMNYEQVRSMYQPSEAEHKISQQTYDYIILTTSELLSAITSSGFVTWKTLLGYNVRIILTDDTLITGQPGGDLSEKIRNFLRSYYIDWGIGYVLLVGDCAAVPMRYCFPDPLNHRNMAGNPSTFSGEVPTDYYYADLSQSDDLSWDLDGDGFYGEYGEDSPDFLAEVYLGRIPTNDTTRITYALNKIVDFELDTGAWKSKALHAGAIAYFENEDHSGRELIDGAGLMDSIETSLMSGWSISHFSEQEGLAPSFYPWAALTSAAFTDEWRNGEYGVVNWYAHGWTNRVSRKIWSWDDGDEVPETSYPDEMSYYGLISTNSNLDDDRPSIVFAVSCMVGYPEPNVSGNLGVDLLTKPSFGSSAGIVSGSRTVWVSMGGGDIIGYEFNRHMIDGPDGAERIGDALYNSKFYCNQTYGWDHYSENWNMFTYNLYGDPSLTREGIEAPVQHGDVNYDGQISVSDVVYLIDYLFRGGAEPLPFLPSGDSNCDGLVSISDVVYLINYLFKGGAAPCS